MRSQYFFFNDTATTEIYTLSLHDALPISATCGTDCLPSSTASAMPAAYSWMARDRKSTRLNSSHLVISYAVFCLKKKNRSISHARYHCSATAVSPIAGTPQPKHRRYTRHI